MGIPLYVYHHRVFYCSLNMLHDGMIYHLFVFHCRLVVVPSLFCSHFFSCVCVYAPTWCSSQVFKNTIFAFCVCVCAHRNTKNPYRSICLLFAVVFFSVLLLYPLGVHYSSYFIVSKANYLRCALVCLTIYHSKLN